MEKKKYRADPYRWVVLAVYSLAAGMIQLMWTTFFSVTTQAWQYYGFQDARTGESAISFLSMIFMIGMIVLSIPSMAAFEKFGFCKSVGFGVLLTGICALARGIWGNHYPVVVLCTVGFSAAQPLLLNSPGLVAGRWFPENERATANSVPLLTSYLCMCAGLLLTPVLLDHGMRIRTMLTVYGIADFAAAVLFLIFARENPRTPACASTETKRESFRAGMKNAVKKRNFILIFLVFFCFLGVFNTFFTMIEPIVRTLSGDRIDTTAIGMLGVIILLAGVAGSLVLSRISDRDPGHRRLPYILVSSLLGIAGLVLILFADNFVLMAAASAVFGFFGSGCHPLILTYAAEAALPTSEGTSEGLLMWGGNVAGVIFLAAAGLLGGQHRLLMVILILIMALCFVPLLMAGEKKKKQA